jgi:hypothetical protein
MTYPLGPIMLASPINEPAGVLQNICRTIE